MSAFMQWAPEHITDILTLIGLVVSAAALLHQNRRAIEVQEIELYHRLETSSIELFKFEAQNAGILEKFQDIELDERKFDDATGAEGAPGHKKFRALQAKYGSMHDFVTRHYVTLEADKSQLTEADVKQQFESYEQERLIVRKFYEQTLNLFEMATRFRNKRIIEPVVFGSWVIWFYDTLIQWGLRDHWPDLRQNYTADLRAVFNKFIAEFDPAEDPRARKRRFFEHVAEVTNNCSIIRSWLPQLDKEAKQFRF